MADDTDDNKTPTTRPGTPRPDRVQTVQQRSNALWMAKRRKTQSSSNDQSQSPPDKQNQSLSWGEKIQRRTDRANSPITRVFGSKEDPGIGTIVGARIAEGVERSLLKPLGTTGEAIYRFRRAESGTGLAAAASAFADRIVSPYRFGPIGELLYNKYLGRQTFSNDPIQFMKQATREFHAIRSEALDIRKGMSAEMYGQFDKIRERESVFERRTVATARLLGLRPGTLTSFSSGSGDSPRLVNIEKRLMTTEKVLADFDVQGFNQLIKQSMDLIEDFNNKKDDSDDSDGGSSRSRRRRQSKSISSSVKKAIRKTKKAATNIPPSSTWLPAAALGYLAPEARAPISAITRVALWARPAVRAAVRAAFTKKGARFVTSKFGKWASATATVINAFTAGGGAIKRTIQGDTTGAVLDGISALTSFYWPAAMTIGLGVDVITIVRDVYYALSGKRLTVDDLQIPEVQQNIWMILSEIHFFVTESVQLKSEREKRSETTDSIPRADGELQRKAGEHYDRDSLEYYNQYSGPTPIDSNKKSWWDRFNPFKTKNTGAGKGPLTAGTGLLSAAQSIFNQKQQPSARQSTPINYPSDTREKSDFLQFGALPRGFEFLPQHRGRLGSPEAVAARGIMPLGGYGGVAGVPGMPSGGYATGGGNAAGYTTGPTANVGREGTYAGSRSRTIEPGVDIPSTPGKFGLTTSTRDQLQLGREPGRRDISLDFNSVGFKSKASGALIVVPDNASPEEITSAKQYLKGLQKLMEKHGHKGYSLLGGGVHGPGIKTTSENRRGVPGVFHTEGWFAGDQKAVDIMSLPEAQQEYASLLSRTLGNISGARFIPPHIAGGNEGATKNIKTGSGREAISETEFARRHILPRLQQIRENMDKGGGPQPTAATTSGLSTQSADELKKQFNLDFRQNKFAREKNLGAVFGNAPGAPGGTTGLKGREHLLKYDPEVINKANARGQFQIVTHKTMEEGAAATLSHYLNGKYVGKTLQEANSIWTGGHPYLSAMREVGLDPKMKITKESLSNPEIAEKLIRMHLIGEASVRQGSSPIDIPSENLRRAHQYFMLKEGLSVSPASTGIAPAPGAQVPGVTPAPGAQVPGVTPAPPGAQVPGAQVPGAQVPGVTPVIPRGTGPGTMEGILRRGAKAYAGDPWFKKAFQSGRADFEAAGSRFDVKAAMSALMASKNVKPVEYAEDMPEVPGTTFRDKGEAAFERLGMSMLVQAQERFQASTPSSYEGGWGTPQLATGYKSITGVSAADGPKQHAGGEDYSAADATPIDVTTAPQITPSVGAIATAERQTEERGRTIDLATELPDRAPRDPERPVSDILGRARGESGSDSVVSPQQLRSMRNHPESAPASPGSQPLGSYGRCFL